MFQTTGQKLLIVGFLVLILSIPLGSFLLSQRFKAQSSQNYDRSVTHSLAEVPKNSPLQDLIKNSTPPSISSSNATSGAEVSYGPNLKFAVSLEGRPKDQQQSKVFVGIALGGQVSPSPQYLLSFTVDVPSSGVSSNISLAGLTTGNSYTAYIKGPAQIVTASSFSMSPTGASLNSGNPISLLTGDVNEDNVIDASDYNLVKAAVGSTSKSTDWNPILDFNQDGVVNSFDLAFVSKNLGKIGDGGAWYSKQGAVASNSASINVPSSIGGESGVLGAQKPTSGGYWLWIPAGN